MKKKYFISYTFKGEKDGVGHASVMVTKPFYKRITMQDIKNFQDYIAEDFIKTKTFKEKPSVVVTAIVRIGDD